MRRVAFTGPSRLRPEERDRAVREVECLLAMGADEFTTGAAPGWDVAVAVAALGAAPKAKHRIVIPAAPYDRDAVDGLIQAALDLGADLSVVTMPQAAEAYRRRNERLVEHADVLSAAVRDPSFYRSGEWMTVNIARRAGVPVRFVDLSAAPLPA